MLGNLARFLEVNTHSIYIIKRDELQDDTCSGNNACIVVNGSVKMQFFYFSSCRMYELI